MIFAGIQKTTLIDFPQKIAATLFTYGCNFRCPFCHNPELVIYTMDANQGISQAEIFDFLNFRKGKLDGVVITGGEPLLQKGLLKFVQKVKQLGFLVKIDTNGSLPEKIEKLQPFVDYWAMDVKNSWEKYNQTAGKKVDIAKVKKSIQTIMKKARDYEFRTTFVPGLHDEESARKIGEIIKGAKKFCIQNFRSGEIIDMKFSSQKTFSRKDLERFKVILSGFVNVVEIRG